MTAAGPFTFTIVDAHTLTLFGMRFKRTQPN